MLSINCGDQNDFHEKLVDLKWKTYVHKIEKQSAEVEIRIV